MDMSMDFSIAELNQEELKAVKAVEDDLKTRTGRDMVLIAWDNKRVKLKESGNIKTGE